MCVGLVALKGGVEERRCGGRQRGEGDFSGLLFLASVLWYVWYEEEEGVSGLVVLVLVMVLLCCVVCLLCCEKKRDDAEEDMTLWGGG